jgi:hypothetical protein
LNNVAVTAVGNITSIKAISATGSGIVDTAAKEFKGANIGTIEAKVTGNGDLAISGAKFEATNGKIDTITASTLGTTATDDAIKGATFKATGDVGAIEATAKAGDALDTVTVTANSDNSTGAGAGQIVSIKATTETGSAILAGSYTGAKIGNIEAIVTGAGGSAISGGTYTASGETAGTGTIGSITITSASTTADAFTGNATFNAGIGVNGNAIGAINVALTNAAAKNAISNVTLDATLNPGGAVLAADQKSDIGAITTTGTNLGITNLKVTAPDVIGTITSSGTGIQSVELNAKTTGTLSFQSLASGNSLTAIIGANVTSLGAITVASPNATVADLSIAAAGIGNLSAITTVGAISVDGKVTLSHSLDKVTSLTSLGVGSFAAPLAQIVIGDSGAAGTTVGGISIGADQANIAPIAVGNPSGAVYRFNFDTYTATPDATVVAQNITAVAVGAYDPAFRTTGSSAAGGFAFIVA